MIEALTGRKVLAFLGQAHVEPDLTIEIFLMDGPLAGFGALELVDPPPTNPAIGDDYRCPEEGGGGRDKSSGGRPSLPARGKFEPFLGMRTSSLCSPRARPAHHAPCPPGGRGGRGGGGGGGGGGGDEKGGVGGNVMEGFCFASSRCGQIAGVRRGGGSGPALSR